MVANCEAMSQRSGEGISLIPVCRPRGAPHQGLQMANIIDTLINMRIVSRPDFDGVVCVVLLKEALGDTVPVRWAQPSDIQNGRFSLSKDDVVANLPLADGDVHMWFDHHVSNAMEKSHAGLFRIAPSAAGLVYEYFQDKWRGRFAELVRQADKIDAAQLTLDEILRPQHYPYVLLSMSIPTRRSLEDEDYCDHLVNLLGKQKIDDVLSDPRVQRRCDDVVIANQAYERWLREDTVMDGHVSITDFRGVEPVPDGNRFLVYSLFPDAVVNMKLYDEGPQVVVKLGHSILNRGCRVNVGRLMAQFGGGGHRGAGACRLARSGAQAHIDEIVSILRKNAPEGE